MITRVQQSITTQNFGAAKPVELGKRAQQVLNKASVMSSVGQRLSLGAVAFIAQPLIDLSNKEVDGETKKAAAARSAGKALVGTATGIVVRGACIKAAESKYAVRDEMGKIVKNRFGKIKIDPEKVKKVYKDIDSESALKIAPSVIGTIAALGVMLISNFVIDAPLTNFVSNKIDDFMHKKQPKKPQNDKAGGING